MPRRRRVLQQPKRNGLGTRLHLFTYALSRLPPRQLPLLGLYAYAVTYASEHGLLDRAAAGKAGGAVVGVLTMVTGLLVSYRFSSAVSKWDEGKKVWVGVRATIRDGIRMLSIGHANGKRSSSRRSEASFGTDLVEEGSSDAPETPANASAHDKDSSDPSIVSSPSKSSRGTKRKITVSERENELAGLFAAFAFALQHHLHRTRPLPQPPLSDLLPVPYLQSLKRTEARVRFAELHAGPSSSYFDAKTGELRPGFRRRGTGPPTEEEKKQAGQAGWDEAWELDVGAIATSAEEALGKLAGSGDDPELRQQLDQLNLPLDEDEQSGLGATKAKGQASIKPKSNLTAPHPANLPLALLRLMEGYVVGLSEVDKEDEGWAEAKRERALAVIKALNGHLAEAERLVNNPPPLPLTLHLSHLLLIYLSALPVSLLCVVKGPYLICITLIAGWCLLGLDALIAEVGGVFGHSENHHPLPQYAQQIMSESLDLNPSFLRSYRARLVARVGDDDPEVVELDKRRRRGGEEWMPSFD